jgi:hypothetical protein
LFTFQPLADIHGCKRVIEPYTETTPFLRPLMNCLTTNQGKLNAITAGHLYALDKVRRATSGLNPDYKCDEILAVYALVLNNNPDSIVSDAMGKWCYSLRRIGLTEEVTMWALSLLTNRFFGISRFGPENSKQYIITLASYWIRALSEHSDTFKSDVRFYYAKLDASIFDMGIDDTNPRGIDFWTYVFGNEKFGISSLIVASIDGMMRSKNPGESAPDIFALAKTYGTSRFPGKHEVTFPQLVNVVNILVDHAVEANIPKP